MKSTGGRRRAMSWQSASCWHELRSAPLALIIIHSSGLFGVSAALPAALPAAVAYHPGTTTAPPAALVALPNLRTQRKQCVEGRRHAVLLCARDDCFGRPRRRRRRSASGALDGRASPPALSAACMDGRESGEAGGAVCTYKGWPGVQELSQPLTAKTSTTNPSAPTHLLRARHGECVCMQADAAGPYQSRTAAARWVVPGQHCEGSHELGRVWRCSMAQ